MSKIRNFNSLKGSNIPKPPSKADVEAMIKKRKKEEKELVEKMNIPPRDENKYPMPDKKDIAEAGSFIYTLGCLAQSYDENLKALVWQFYVDLKECVKRDSTQNELFSMIKTLTDLKEYLAASKNPLFAEPEKKPEGEKVNENTQSV